MYEEFGQFVANRLFYSAVDAHLVRVPARIQMQRSTAVLSCKLCGRPYFPGERIEIVGLCDDSAVAHVECIDNAVRQLLNRSRPGPEISSEDMQRAKTLVDVSFQQR